MARRLRDGQRGSTLLLFPAAVLIMVALAAITVDSAIAFMAQRELANATAAAANDAATEALSDRSFYQRDRIELSPSAVEAVAVDRVLPLVDPARHHGLTVQAEPFRRPAPAARGPSGWGPRRGSTSCSAKPCPAPAGRWRCKPSRPRRPGRRGGC